MLGPHAGENVDGPGLRRFDLHLGSPSYKLCGKTTCLSVCVREKSSCVVLQVGTNICIILRGINTQ